MKIKIAPSILSADFSRLGEQVQEAIQAGADWIHVDVMDGHFVPNITIGPLVAAALAPIAGPANVPLDVHLMIEHPERIIPAFAEAGANYLNVHVETCPNLHQVIKQIRELGVKPAVALNPATPLIAVEEILGYVDMVLIMSVNPGFGGQSYIPTSTSRITRLRKILDDRGLSEVDIEVDGGIKIDNAAMVAEAGASVLVSGSGIFNSKSSVYENITAIRARISKLKPYPIS